MIDWDKIWEDLDEWCIQDETEGKKPKTSDLRKYVELLVEKQLRREVSNDSRS